MIRQIVDARIESALNRNPSMGFNNNNRPMQGMQSNFDGHHGMKYPDPNQQHNSRTQSGGTVMNGNSMDGQHQHPMSGYQSHASGMNPMAGGAINGAQVSGSYPIVYHGNGGSHH